MTHPVTFSFIIPTRGRPESLPRLCDSILKNTHRPEELEIVFVMDSDDDSGSLDFTYPALNIRILQVEPGMTMAQLNTAGYRATVGQYVMLLNDDSVIGTPDWDDIVYDVLRSYPDGIVLVHIDEAIFHETLCTFPCLTRTYCEMAGGIAPEVYSRYRIDDHIHNVFDLLAILGYHRRVFVPGVVFPHLNLTETEEGHHEYVPNPEVHALDSKRFHDLLPERKRLALRLVEHIQQHARQEDRTVREARLAEVTDSVAIRHARHARWYPPLADPDGQPRVTVAVVSADVRSEHATRCIDLLKQHTQNFELVIVDNNRGPGFNHSREMNRLMEHCRTDYLALLDDDIFVEPGWLDGLLRAMEPGVGVATPIHKDSNGQFSYAGVVMQPDDSGHHTHVMRYGGRPHHIQTLCSAAMLIDMNRCGHIRLNETYTKYFLDIDYGLRIWEAGLRVVCSPWSVVTHVGGGTLMQGSQRSVQLFEEQRLHFVREWVETGRLNAMRRKAWPEIPEFREMSRMVREIERLFFEQHRLSKDAFFTLMRSVMQELDALPALKNYLGARAARDLNGTLPDAEDPKIGNLSILMSAGGQPILYERHPSGMNIVLWNLYFYAIPANEGAFHLHGRYSRRYEAATPQQIRQMIADGLSMPAPAQNVAPPTLTTYAEVDSLPALAPLGPIVNRILGTAPHLGVLSKVKSLFDPAYYREQNPDIAAAGVNPLLHYLFTGGFEGRQPNPFFDSSFYLRRYPDVAAARINPLVHYVRHGAAEGRQPNPGFDPGFYLEVHPDVRKSGVNPLLHYVLYGAAEGRRTQP